ncbi:MAG TPA: PExPT-CTERM protein [Edaphobacter sp.]
MKQISFLLTVLAVIFVAALPLHAQTGCAESPENPTVILAAVGSAGGLFVSVRARLKARSK